MRSAFPAPARPAPYVLAAALALAPTVAPAASTLLPGGGAEAAQPQAWSANAGWINCRPSAAEGIRVQARRLSGWSYAANLGWIHFGDDTPGDQPHPNTAADNTGVNRDAAGNLSGYAYGANVGWIHFGWAAPDDPQRPRTDLSTGRFLGYAYSANLGWIDLAAAGLAHDVVAFPDTDLDGLPDSWEATHFGNLADADATTDHDGDGVNDLAEYQGGSDPHDIDSPAPAQPSTISGLAHHLYSADAGWIDARPNARFGLRVGEYFLSGWLSSPNLGWIHVGDGSPGSGHAYLNGARSPDDYGVNLSVSGALSGYAYGANVGWINFGWAGANDPNRPRLDFATGSFSGYVYSANIGWIAFVSSELRTTTLERIDSDADSMDDAWERRHFSNLFPAGIGTDSDRDGQSDAAEYVSGTDPRNAADFFLVTAYTVVGGMTQVGIEFTSSEKRRYRIEYTDDLASGSWLGSPLGEFAPDPGTRTSRSFTLPTTASARFFRVIALLPLTP